MESFLNLMNSRTSKKNITSNYLAKLKLTFLLLQKPKKTNLFSWPVLVWWENIKIKLVISDSIFKGYLVHFPNSTLKTFPWKKLAQKKCLMFFPKTVSLIFFLKKSFFLYFGKWNFLALRLKNVLYFLKKSFAYNWGTF